MQKGIKNTTSIMTQNTRQAVVFGNAEKILTLPDRDECRRIFGESCLLEKCTFAYPCGANAESSQTNALEGIDLDLAPGELVIVTSNTDSHKSSLLLALLGDLELKDGKNTFPAGPVAYQPQKYPLLNDTIRANVLFGMDEEDEALVDMKVQTALKHAHLAEDFDSHPTLSDLREYTSCGLGGNALSGGQRARVAIARTVMTVLSGAEMVLMDDPVAALDNHTIEAVWESAVLKAMSGATRIVVLNTQLLPRLVHTADRVVVLASDEHGVGSVAFNGTPNEFKESDCGLAVDKLASRPITNETASAMDRFKAIGKSTIERIANRNMVSRMLKQSHDQLEQHVPHNVMLKRQESVLEPVYNPAQLATFMHQNMEISEFLESKDIDQGEVPQLSNSTLVQLRQHLRDYSKYHRHHNESCQPAKNSQLDVIWMFFRLQWISTALAMLCTMLADAAMPLAMVLLQRWVKSGFVDVSVEQALFCFAALALADPLLRSLGQCINGWASAQLALTQTKQLDHTLVSLSESFFNPAHGSQADVTMWVNFNLGDFAEISAVPLVLATVLFNGLAVAFQAPFLLPLVLLSSVLRSSTKAPQRWALSHVRGIMIKLSSKWQLRVSSLLSFLFEAMRLCSGLNVIGRWKKRSRTEFRLLQQNEKTNSIRSQSGWFSVNITREGIGAEQHHVLISWLHP